MYTRADLRVPIYTYTHTCMRTYIDICIYTHINVYLHAHIYIYTFIYNETCLEAEVAHLPAQPQGTACQARPGGKSSCLNRKAG